MGNIGLLYNYTEVKSKIKFCHMSGASHYTNTHTSASKMQWTECDEEEEETELFLPLCVFNLRLKNSSLMKEALHKIQFPSICSMLCSMHPCLCVGELYL